MDCCERLVELFLSKYETCFYENGGVKNCGRDACIELIVVSQDLGKKLGVKDSYGDIHSGYMNIENIAFLHSLILIGDKDV